MRTIEYHLAPFSLRSVVMVLALSMTAGCLKDASAQTPMRELARKVGIRVLADGVSGHEERTEAVRRLPYRKLTLQNQRRLNSVLNNCAQYRRLPSLQYVVAPEMFQYLVSNPDVAVSTWRAMGISRFQMWQTGPMDYEAAAPDGSEGIADILYRDETQTLMFCSGTYSNPFLPSEIVASAVLWMRYDFVTASDGSRMVNQNMDVFVAFPSSTAHAIAKLASPLTNVIMDRNLFEIALYARMMSKALATEPEWVVNLANNMEGVLPVRKQELKALAESAYRSNPSTAVRTAGRPPQGHAVRPNMPLTESSQFRVFESSLSHVEAMVPTPVVKQMQQSVPAERRDSGGAVIVPRSHDAFAPPATKNTDQSAVPVIIPGTRVEGNSSGTPTRTQAVRKTDRAEVVPEVPIVREDTSGFRLQTAIVPPPTYSNAP